MAFNHVWDKNHHRNYPLRSNGGGISKRTINVSRSALAFAVALSNSDSNSSITSEDSASSSSNSTLPSPRPPLHPRNRGSSSPLQTNFSSSWRSFSVADLHNCAIAATIKMSSIENEEAHPS